MRNVLECLGASQNVINEIPMQAPLCNLSHARPLLCLSQNRERQKLTIVNSPSKDLHADATLKHKWFFVCLRWGECLCIFNISQLLSVRLKPCHKGMKEVWGRTSLAGPGTAAKEDVLIHYSEEQHLLCKIVQWGRLCIKHKNTKLSFHYKSPQNLDRK